MTMLPVFADVVGHGREVDLGDRDALRAAVAAAAPEVIVNAAAYNDVDGAESDEQRATLVNGHAVALLGGEAAERKAILIHYSTDFVFDGRSERPYRESDATAPLSAYGRSKLFGEERLTESEAPAIVLRTAWVYSLRRRSFVRTILRAARERDSLRVVDDQIGCPTRARDLALATALLLHGVRRDPFGELAPLRGIYHLAGAGQASRYQLAKAALELDPLRGEQRAREVLPIASGELPSPARRPCYAVLDCAKARQELGLALVPWKESLEAELANHGPIHP
jgi:dTDP-4-dehydrorhamnose reductase